MDLKKEKETFKQNRKIVKKGGKTVLYLFLSMMRLWNEEKSIFIKKDLFRR